MFYEAVLGASESRNGTTTNQVLQRASRYDKSTAPTCSSCSCLASSLPFLLPSLCFEQALQLLLWRSAGAPKLQARDRARTSPILIKLWARIQHNHNACSHLIH